MVTGTDGRRRRHNAAERVAVLERLASSRKSVSAFCGAESIGSGDAAPLEERDGSGAGAPRSGAERFS